MFETFRILDSYRKRSDDRAEAIPHAGGVVIVLADGAGGTSGGAEAAGTVVMWAREYVTSGRRDLDDPAMWAEFLAKMDFQISCEGGQTTAVVVAATAEGLCGASVGDSAAWAISASGCCDLTGNQVHKQLLGSGSARPVPFQTQGFSGTLLVASDGLVKYARRELICRCALEKDLPSAARKIVDLARLRSGQLQDDVSLVLCRRREPASGRLSPAAPNG